MVLKTIKLGKTVGFLELSFLKNGDLEILYLWVSPEHRGNGFATRLLKRAIKVAKSKNKYLVAFVEPHKDSSLTYAQELEWLKRHGFSSQSRYQFGERNFKPVMIYTPQ